MECMYNVPGIICFLLYKECVCVCVGKHSFEVQTRKYIQELKLYFTLFLKFYFYHFIFTVRPNYKLKRMSISKLTINTRYPALQLLCDVIFPFHIRQKRKKNQFD